MSTTRTTLRQANVALRAMLVFTIVLGIGYTLLITGIGQLILPWQANGSRGGGRRPRPSAPPSSDSRSRMPTARLSREYFQPRPSAAGDGYDGGASSGSNYGPENTDLIAAIEDRKAAIADVRGRRPCRDPRRCGHRFRLWPRPAHQPRVCAAPGRPRRGGARPRRAGRPRTSWSLGFRHGTSGSSASRGSTCWSSTSRSTPSRADSDGGRIDR